MPMLNLWATIQQEEVRQSHSSGRGSGSRRSPQKMPEGGGGMSAAYVNLAAYKFHC